MRSALLTASMIVLAAGTAHAEGPTARVGVTIGLADQGAPEQFQVGPMLAIGIPLGRFVVEADYALLSFMEPDVVDDGNMHRFGVNVRAELLRPAHRCLLVVGCVNGLGGYAEIGAALRHGQWHLDANTKAPANANRQRELHVGLGFELDNRYVRWQLGLRFAAAPRDDLMLACRGTGCPAGAQPGNTGQMDLAALIEWMFVFGR
jgi:hypothetical protein